MNSHVEFCGADAPRSAALSRSAALPKLGKLARPCSDLDTTLFVSCLRFLESRMVSLNRAGKELDLARMTYTAAMSRASPLITLEAVHPQHK